MYFQKPGQIGARAKNNRANRATDIGQLDMKGAGSVRRTITLLKSP
jgi:hypothetical protein